MVVVGINFVSSAEFTYNYLEQATTENITNYINATVNSTQFSSNNPITINTTWLYNYISGLFDTVYCKLTGCVMTGDLEINNAGINNTNFVGFNTSYVNGVIEGRLQWNDDDGTLEFGMPGGNINLHVGQQMLLRVRNDESFTINKGKVVYLFNATGQRATVKLADYQTENESFKVLGVAAEDISASQFGYIITEGYLTGFDTSSLIESQPVYLGANGTLTSTEPQTPNHSVKIGETIYTHAVEGKIYVHLNLGQEIDTLHDVSINNPSNGEVLIYNTTSQLWENGNITTSGYVPYTGATGNVELNDKNLTNISVLDINDKTTINNNNVGFCFNGTDYIFGNYTGVAGC